MPFDLNNTLSYRTNANICCKSGPDWPLPESEDKGRTEERENKGGKSHTKQE